MHFSTMHATSPAHLIFIDLTNLLIAKNTNHKALAKHEALTPLIMNKHVFWDVTSCWLVHSYQNFKAAKYLWNVVNYLL